MSIINKAVFPVAGLGTRFLPATKANPKEMLPIVDKPLIQYAVEGAVTAGIKELIFVTSGSKRAIEDHFDRNFELELFLAEREKHELLDAVQDILPRNATCAYVRQHEPLGLGHAILCAESLVGDEPFAVSLADDLIDNGETRCLQRMVEIYQQTPGCYVALESIDINNSSRYGMVELSNDELPQITSVVEKPEPAQAPSNLAIVGRYILSPSIFAQLHKLAGNNNGQEVQLTDAIAAQLNDQPYYAYQIEGQRYDCGSKLGYLQATVAYGLKHPQVGEAFRAYLREVAQ